MLGDFCNWLDNNYIEDKPWGHYRHKQGSLPVNRATLVGRKNAVDI